MKKILFLTMIGLVQASWSNEHNLENDGLATSAASQSQDKIEVAKVETQPTNSASTEINWDEIPD